MKHKIIPMIVCLMLCVALMPAAAFADSAKTTPAAPPGIWTDHAAEGFAGGSGTAEDPYLIETPEQLAKLAADINSGVGDKTHSKEHFQLTADLDLSAHRWIPIGTSITTPSFRPFFGYFNGNGKIITGMYVDESESGKNAGLFGNITGILLENITIKNGYVKASTENGNDNDGAGILIGSATVSGGQNLGTKVQNCSVNGIVENVNGRAGGLAGYNAYSTYKNCTADVTINGAGTAGGFVGEDFSGKYKGCVAKGKVNGAWSVGGFAGHIRTNVQISNCVAFSDVESKVDGVETKTGGFAGTVDGTNGKNTISNSHAAGKVTSTKAGYKPGGFVGEFYGFSMKYTHLNACSYDAEKNVGIEAIGGETSADVDGVEGISTQAVKDNICKDYYGKHIVKEVAEKPAACTEDGHEAYWKCENCGRLFADEKGTQQIEKPAVIPATGHKLGDWKVIKEATATEKGEKERVCSRCQFVEKAEIPAIGATRATDPAKANADNSAKTGDDSNPVLYGLLVLLAACGAVGALWRKRKV